jgi:lysophospholipase L1-like esterase
MLRCYAIAAALFLSATLAHADSPITLKQGDRIVFLGDSITQGGGGPKGFVTLIKKELAEKKPDLGIEVFNAGISGNKVPDLQGRVERDVIARKPTIVFIYIGINDVWHGEKDPARGTTPEKFEAGLKEVIGKIQAAGAKVVLCTPSVIGEQKDGVNNLDAKLDQYAGISRKLATDMKLPLCDLREAFVEHLKANNPDNKASGILTGDRVHLNSAGNQLVADEMSKVIGL